MGSGYGQGKVILFGEHFVVYGAPAIVSALSAKTIATVERMSEGQYELVDLRPATPGYKEQKAKEQAASLDNIFRAMNIDPRRSPVRITLSGDLVAASGVGASAAGCAAIARALSEEFGLGYDDERINEIAFEGEKGFHGTPSGIDNTAAVYGGVLLFRRRENEQRPYFERISVHRAFEIVEADSGKVASTREVVADVRKMKEAHPEKFERILISYDSIVSEAVGALREGNLVRLGELMNLNMELLRQIGVSSDDLERMIAIALRHGALGAKLTGTGRGGLMFALTPGRALQQKVADALHQEGYTTFISTIGIYDARGEAAPQKADKERSRYGI